MLSVERFCTLNTQLLQIRPLQRLPAGKYPAAVYHPAIQRVLTFALPIALISGLPAEALFGRSGLLAALAAALAAVLSIGLTALVWRGALRRYVSATA